MISGTAQVSHQVCQFLSVSSVCLLVRVTVVDKNKAVLFCLLATSAIMLSGKKKRKRKIWGKKWHLKTQGSPLVYSFWKFECLEMMPSWCRQVNWGNCGIPWVNCAVFCVKDGWKGQFWGLPVKTAQFTQFFHQVWRHTVKSLGLTESV